MGHHRDVVYRGLQMALCRLADGIMSNKDMCAFSEAVGNVNHAMMRMDRWRMKLLHGRLEVLYI